MQPALSVGLSDTAAAEDSSRRVNVSSIAAGVPFGARPLYGAGKAVLEQSKRCMRCADAVRYVELGRFGTEFFGVDDTRHALPMGLAHETVCRVQVDAGEIPLGGDRIAGSLQRGKGRPGRRAVKDTSPDRSEM